LDGLPPHSRKREALLKSAENVHWSIAKTELNRHALKAWLQRSGPHYIIKVVTDKLKEVEFRGGMLGCEEAAVLVLAYLTDNNRRH